MGRGGDDFSQENQNKMKSIQDHGHVFELLTLDGDGLQYLKFVKREDTADPMKFPGNHGSHSGTTIQSVVRVLHSRVAFLDSQHHCVENTIILEHLRAINYLLEIRAAQRHNRPYPLNAHEAIDAPMCPKCGHTACEHQTKTK